MIVIYISSPYTIGDVGKNVSIHLNVANILISKGYCVIAPLLSHFLHILQPRDYKTWMEMDLELIRRCDIVLCLSGDNRGTEEEERFTKSINKPVVYNVEELDIFVGKNFN